MAARGAAARAWVARRRPGTRESAAAAGAGRNGSLSAELQADDEAEKKKNNAGKAWEEQGLTAAQVLLVRASVPSPRNDASADAPDAGASQAARVDAPDAGTSQAARAPAVAAAGSADAPGLGASTEGLAPGTSADAPGSGTSGSGSGTSAPPGSSVAKAVDVGWGQDGRGAGTSPGVLGAGASSETDVLGSGASGAADVLESGASVPPSAARRELEGLLR